jgi:hypothetical protein
MAGYDVYLNVTVSPVADEAGNVPPGMLNFGRRFLLEGTRFADIGVRIDALCDAIDTVLTAAPEDAAARAEGM